MQRLLLFGLLLTLASAGSTARGQEGIEFILEDTAAQFLRQLSARGTSGERTSVLLPRETYEVALEEAENGRPSHYLIHRAPMRAEVEHWRIESATFTAKRLTLLSPSIQLYQGTPESIEGYLRPFPNFDSTLSDEPVIPAGDPNPERPEPAGATAALEFVRSEDTFFRIEKLEVRQGSLVAVNTLSASSAPVRMTAIELDASGLVIPDRRRAGRLDWELAFDIQGTSPGHLWVRVHDESKKGLANFGIQCKVDSLDLSSLAPFLPLEERWKIRSGLGGLVLDATCVNNQYSSSNRLRFKSLNIESEDDDSWLKSLAAKAIAKAGSLVYEDVQLDFEVSGDLSNSEFDLGEAYAEAFQQALLRWTTLQALRKLGLTEK